LNKINIKRKSKEDNNFENIGYIFVTRNKKILKIAWHNLIKKEGNVPLATTLDWLTNKFWFKLNKGFGNNVTPRNSDIVLKSRIIFSSIIGDKAGVEYDKMMKEIKAGNLAEEQAKNRLNQLRNIPQKPEDIIAEDLKLIISFLNEDSLEKSKNESDYIKQQIKAYNSSNKELQSQLERKERELQLDKKDNLKIKQKYLLSLEKKYKRVNKLFFFAKNTVRFILPPIVLFLSVLFSIKIFGNFADRNIGILSNIIQIVIPLSYYLFLILFNRKIKVLPFINKLYGYIEKKCQAVCDFDYDEYTQLKNEINSYEEDKANHE